MTADSQTYCGVYIKNQHKKTPLKFHYYNYKVKNSQQNQNLQHHHDSNETRTRIHKYNRK